MGLGRYRCTTIWYRVASAEEYAYRHEVITKRRRERTWQEGHAEVHLRHWPPFCYLAASPPRGAADAAVIRHSASSVYGGHYSSYDKCAAAGRRRIAGTGYRGFHCDVIIAWYWKLWFDR